MHITWFVYMVTEQNPELQRTDMALLELLDFSPERKVRYSVSKNFAGNLLFQIYKSLQPNSQYVFNHVKPVVNANEC